MMNIYLTNLGKYTEGELVGEWVKLPVSDEELKAVKKRIGINKKYEEFFITDYECDVEGVEINEYSNLGELNNIAELLEDIDEDKQLALQAMLLDGYEFADALDKVDDGDYRIYSDCSSMIDIAYQVVEECGYLENVPDNVARYFDYEAFGRDLEIEGKYYIVNGYYVEIID